jgi:hypothetical protein
LRIASELSFGCTIFYLRLLHGLLHITAVIMTPVTQNDPKPQDEFAVQVKIALVRQESTVTKLASELKVARPTASKAIHHPATLPALAQRIREHLNLEGLSA